MLQKTVVRFLVVTAALGLLAGAGCKKKKAEKPAESKTAAAMAAGMQADAMGAAHKASMRPASMGAGPMDARRVAPAAAWKPGLLPFPADAVLVRLNLKAARASSLYKAFQAKIKAFLDKETAKDEILKAMFTKCGMNPMTDVNEVIIGASLAGTAKGNMIAVVKGTFDTAKAFACMAPIVKKNKVKDVTVAGKKGAIYKTKKGEQVTYLPLDAHTLLVAGAAAQARLGDLLSGKAPSITGTPLFKQYGPKVGANTLIAVLLPTLPASLTAKMPLPVLKGIKSVALMLALPAGGFDLKGALDVGDNAKAGKLAKAIPMFIGMAKAKLGAVGNTIVQNFKSKADGTWVKLSLTLNKADFAKVMGMAKGLLKIR